MYKDDSDYKRYKEEYDAYQDEKQELIKELEKEEEKNRTMKLIETMTKIKNEKKYDFLVITHNDFVFAVKYVDNVVQYDLYELDQYIKIFADYFEMLVFIDIKILEM